MNNGEDPNDRRRIDREAMNERDERCWYLQQQGWSVRAIAVSEVSPERIFLRDAKVYCAILLDNNNRKPIIRLNFHGKNVKFVTTFESGKDGIRRDIESVVDIYKVALEPIRRTIRHYESGSNISQPQ